MNTSIAWAVGVTGLYRTTDGGKSWQPAGEPKRPLVRVAFVGPATGYALTGTGQFVLTHDGGRSWRSTGWSGRGGALCATNSKVLVVAGQTGGLWRSADGGVRWQRVAPGYARLPGFSGWVPGLSCSRSGAVEKAQAFCMDLIEICRTEVITRVRMADATARVWHRSLAQRAAEPAAGGVDTQPPGALSVPVDDAVARGDGLCVVGYSFSPPIAAGLSCSGRPDRGFVRAVIPRLPLPAGRSTVHVQGLQFVNARVGFLVIDEYTAAATPNQSQARTEVWGTRDGGARWTVIYVGPVYHPPAIDQKAALPGPARR